MINIDELEQYALESNTDVIVNREVLLKLITVFRATAEYQRLMNLPMRVPKGTHELERIRYATYGKEKQAAWKALIESIESLRPSDLRHVSYEELKEHK